MRLGYIAVMRVIMMRVVLVKMVVLQFFMGMVMSVPLGQMKPEADRHEHAGDQKLWRDGFMQQQNRQNRADGRCERKISPGSGRAKMAEAQHEHDEADPDAKEPDNAPCACESGRWQGCTKSICEGQIDTTRNQSLDHGDLFRVGS